MLFNSPLSPQKADRIIAKFNLPVACRVLDIGCGDGEFLLRVAEQYEIVGLGVDLNADLIEQAQVSAAKRGKEETVRFTTQDATDLPNEQFNLIICMGAEYIFGGYREALHKLKGHLTQGGLLLMGTIYWKGEISADYLTLMDNQNPHFDHATTMTLAREQRFFPLHIWRSNDDEWDDFESDATQRRYRQATSQAERNEIIRWQDGYLKWGIDTMGFGFYLMEYEGSGVITQS